jgi:DNA repair protein RadA/Sms
MTGTRLVGAGAVRALRGGVDGEVGAAVACALEGAAAAARDPSLVAPTDLAMPRRVGTGSTRSAGDGRRRHSRHAGIALGQADVFVNVAGGVRIDEPGTDLRSRSRCLRGQARR